MSAMDALVRARLAWEASEPQLFIDFDALEEVDRNLTDGVGGLGGSVHLLERAQPGGCVSSLPNPTPPTSARRPPEGALGNIEGGGARCLAKRAAPTGGL